MRHWEELEAKIAEMPQFEPNVVDFRRMYLSAAVECELDKQGRILVPPSLREHAGLTKNVLWLGHGQKAELWSREQWEALSRQKSAADLRELRAALGKLGL
jgi:MraZ protein